MAAEQRGGVFSCWGFFQNSGGFHNNTSVRLSQLGVRDAGHVTPLIMCLAFSSLIERQCLEGAELPNGLRYRLPAPSHRYRGSRILALVQLLLLLVLVLTWFPLSRFTQCQIEFSFFAICADTDWSVSLLYYTKSFLWLVVLRLMLTGECVKV